MKRVLIVVSLVFLCISCKYTDGVDAYVIQVDASGRWVISLIEDASVREQYEDMHYATDNNDRPITGTVMYYYKSGKLEKEIPFKNGKKEGIQKRYDESGKLEYEEPYKNGKPEGIWKQYNENGELLLEVSYQNGKQEGITKQYGESGELLLEASYQNGKQEGITKQYNESGELLLEVSYQNGVKMQETPFKDGKKEGIEKHYDENGELKQEILYKDGQQENKKWCNKDGIPVWVTSYKKGKKDTETIYGNRYNSSLRIIRYKDGQLESKQQIYRRSGRLFWEISYKDGITKRYFGNGDLWFSATYEGGVCGDGREFTSVDVANDGPIEFCRAQRYADSEVDFTKSYATYSGMPFTGIVIGDGYEAPYKDGKREGLLKAYDDDKLTQETPYKNGKEEGIKKYYYGNGKLKYEKTYREGKLDGIAKYYDESGKLLLSMTYKDDEIVRGVFENGKEYNYSDLIEHYFADYIAQESGREFGMTYRGDNVVHVDVDISYGNHGYWVSLYIKNGKRYGIEKTYNSGLLAYETPYKDGRKEGVAKEYVGEYLVQETSYKNGKREGLNKRYGNYYGDYSTFVGSVTYKNDVAISGVFSDGSKLTSDELMDWENEGFNYRHRVYDTDEGMK